MTHDRDKPHQADIERAAEERRRSIERPEKEGTPDSSGLFNPVEGVAPDSASVPDKDGR